MNIESFLAHHGLTENPFNAEEARHDPVFARLSESTTTHPDFGKILGRIDAPSTSIVFGEKGSGKTAIRLLIGKKVAEHNAAYPESRTLLIPYDDLNPMLDRLQQRHGGGSGTASDVLQKVRLADHQDAILSLATTRLVDAVLEQAAPGDEPLPLPDGWAKRIRKLPRRVRVDLVLLAALYDQPPSGAIVPRWRALARRLKLGLACGLGAMRLLAIALTIVTVIALLVAMFLDTQPRWPVQVLAALLVAGSLVAWGVYGWQHLTLGLRSRRIRREMPAVDRRTGELAAMLGGIRGRDRDHMTMPGVAAKDAGAAAHSDARYQLTRRLLDVLSAFGYRGIIVLVDRVDEPTLISGHPDRMRPVVWPLLDNKLLQQDRVGVILLLPIELRYLVQRESSEFYQHARLDKQSMIDRLSWSGATLYDLCTARLRVCRAAGSEPLYLTDLFEQDVTREMLIDALDQMHQPRDAFKFLYAVIQEHCRTVPEDQPQWRIPRLTLESVRRGQAQRVQELFRGLAPA
jgi:hypothetical protein